MNNLYNKILNEVYLIQDFDSWDNSENTFKDVLKDSLRGETFIYKQPWPKNAEVHLNLLGVDCIKENPWLENNIFFQGKQIPIDIISTWKICRTKHPWPLTGEIPIVLRNIQKVNTCKNLFYKSDLMKVPEGLFFSENSDSTGDMFSDCKYLKEVPFIQFTQDLLEWYGKASVSMFWHCPNLSTKTKSIWKIDFLGGCCLKEIDKNYFNGAKNIK